MIDLVLEMSQPCITSLMSRLSLFPEWIILVSDNGYVEEFVPSPRALGLPCSPNNKSKVKWFQIVHVVL